MRSTYLLCGLLILGGVLLGGAAAAAEPSKKEALIRSKIKTVELVREKIAERISQARIVKQHLDEMMGELADEILYDCETLGIASYKEAAAHPRLERSLRLTRQLFSYLDVVDGQIRSMQKGDQQLRYLRQEADDNLKIIATMTNVDITAFIQEVEQMAQRSMAQARSQLFSIKDISYQHTEETWKRIRGNNAG